MSRRVFLLGVGIVLVALGLAITDWVLSLQPGVTEANFKRIRVGMTEAEVQAILGGVPQEKLPYPSTDGWFYCVWDGSTGNILVAFGRDDGRVRRAPWWSPDPPRLPPTPLLARLRSWLGR
jgi:hypothetical protein